MVMFHSFLYVYQRVYSELIQPFDKRMFLSTHGRSKHFWDVASSQIGVWCTMYISIPSSKPLRMVSGTGFLTFFNHLDDFGGWTLMISNNSWALKFNLCCLCSVSEPPSSNGWHPNWKKIARRYIDWHPEPGCIFLTTNIFIPNISLSYHIISYYGFHLRIIGWSNPVKIAIVDEEVNHISLSVHIHNHHDVFFQWQNEDFQL